MNSHDAIHLDAKLSLHTMNHGELVPDQGSRYGLALAGHSQIMENVPEIPEDEASDDEQGEKGEKGEKGS
jgi:hypothetical protein